MTDPRSQVELPRFREDAQSHLERTFGIAGMTTFPRTTQFWATPSAWVYDLAYEPCTDVPEIHAHEQGVVELVLSGEYTESYWRSTRHPRAGDVIYTAPAVEHGRGSIHTNVRVFTIKFTPGTLGRTDNAAPDLIGANTVALARRVYLESKHPDASSHLAVESLVSEMAGAIARRPTCAPHPGLERTRQMLHDIGCPPTLTELALECGLNPQHLSRAFRSQYGCSPGRYHRRLRLEGAARRLAASREPITAIAHEFGFSDQSHFGRHFKRAYGVAPRAYRRVMQA